MMTMKELRRGQTWRHLPQGQGGCIELTREVKKALRGLSREEKAEALQRAEYVTMDGEALGASYDAETLDAYESGEDVVRRMIELDCVNEIVAMVRKGE